MLPSKVSFPSPKSLTLVLADLRTIITFMMILIFASTEFCKLHGIKRHVVRKQAQFASWVAKCDSRTRKATSRTFAEKYAKEMNDDSLIVQTYSHFLRSDVDRKQSVETKHVMLRMCCYFNRLSVFIQIFIVTNDLSNPYDIGSRDEPSYAGTSRGRI